MSFRLTGAVFPPALLANETVFGHGIVCACALMTWVASPGLLFSFGIFLPVFMDYFNESREATGQ